MILWVGKNVGGLTANEIQILEYGIARDRGKERVECYLLLRVGAAHFFL